MRSHSGGRRRVPSRAVMGMRLSKASATSALGSALIWAFRPLVARIAASRYVRYARFLPALWVDLGEYAPGRTPHRPVAPALPEALRSYPGIRRDRDAEERAFVESPL